jgi:four helix bundle protein
MMDFRRLAVWQKAHGLALEVYRATGRFPRDEIYGLTGQLRRGTSSIPANLAEGCGRGGDIEFRRFRSIALGSACELESHLLLAKDLGLLAPDRRGDLEAQVQETKRMLVGLMQKRTSASPRR